MTEIIKGVDINAKNLAALSGKPRKVLLLPNIQIVGVNLPENQNVLPEDINLTDSGGEGVKFRGIVADGIKQAIVVKYLSVKDILSREELQKSVDNTIQTSTSCNIQSKIISFSTTPKSLHVSQNIKIFLQNNQVCVYLEMKKMLLL